MAQTPYCVLRGRRRIERTREQLERLRSYCGARIERGVVGPHVLFWNAAYVAAQLDLNERPAS